MRFNVDRLDHLVLTVRDVDRTCSWYQRVLGMDHDEYGTPPRATLKFGGQKINVRPEQVDDWGTAVTATVGSADLCFVTSVGVDDIVAHLDGCGVKIEDGPVARLGALGPIRSVYCRDPDGNLIEISSYLDD